MRQILLNGESKVGSSTVGDDLKQVLSGEGHTTRHVVAGDFFRFVTAETRALLELADHQALPEDQELEKAVRHVLQVGKVFGESPDDTVLQATPVAKSVSILGSLDIAQQAGYEWFGRAFDEAQESEVGILIVDGRSPRRVLEEQRGNRLNVTLDLLLQCDIPKSAVMSLCSRGNHTPTDAELKAEEALIAQRRQRDREPHRLTRFVDPPHLIDYIPGITPIETVLDSTWNAPSAELPYPVSLDITPVDKEPMLVATRELGLTAVSRAVLLNR